MAFAGKEKDTETGLSYFGARYFGSSLGRFSTVDRILNVEASLAEPQRWNRYSYALNNPFRYVDTDGNDPKSRALAELGEKVTEYELQRQGYSIMLSAGRKGVFQSGFDTIAARGSEVLIVDNKAFLSRRTASTATALVENLAPNLSKALGELDAKLGSAALSRGEAALVEQTIAALRAGAFQRVVTGGGGIVSRVGSRLAAAGVVFRGAGQIGGMVAGPLLFIATEGYFAEGVGGFEADTTLSPEAEELWGRFKAGEDILGEGTE
jgi:RHS repeat-associated protein